MTIDQRIEFLMRSIESHDRQIGALGAQIAQLKSSAFAVVDDRSDDVKAIDRLAEIAEGHGRRGSSREVED